MPNARLAPFTLLLAPFTLPLKPFSVQYLVQKIILTTSYQLLTTLYSISWDFQEDVFMKLVNAKYLSSISTI